MQEIRSSNPHMVTGICDPNKSWARHNRSFRYAVTIALNHEKIKKDPQRVTKIKLFINKHNWEKIDFPLEKDDWKNIERNNVTIALDVKKRKC